MVVVLKGNALSSIMNQQHNLLFNCILFICIRYDGSCR